MQGLVVYIMKCRHQSAVSRNDTRYLPVIYALPRSSQKVTNARASYKSAALDYVQVGLCPTLAVKLVRCTRKKEEKRCGTCLEVPATALMQLLHSRSPWITTNQYIFGTVSRHV